MDRADSFSVYNPVINFTFYIFALILCMVNMHPAYVAVSVFFSITYYVTIKGLKASAKRLLTMGIIFLLIALLNPVIVQNGDTVLFRCLGRVFTKEALVYGMCSAGMVISVLMWFSSYNLVMTSDKFMYVFSDLIPSLSLILTMVLRLVPTYKKKAEQIASARACIGKFSESTSFADKVNDGMTVLSSLMSWALEGGVMTSDSMQSRGYGSGKRTKFSVYSFGKKDVALLAVMGTAIILSIAFMIATSTGIEFYPVIIFRQVDSPVFILGISSYALFLSIPTIINVKENIIWHILRSRI